MSADLAGDPDRADSLWPAGGNAGRNQASTGQDDDVLQQGRLDSGGRSSTLIGRQPGTADSLRPGIDRLVLHCGRRLDDLHYPEPGYRGPGCHSATYIHHVHRGQCGRAHGAAVVCRL